MIGSKLKILYISPGDHLDYQDDCLFIGLCELLGPSVIDVNKRIHVYDSFDENNVKNLYGKGMTVTRVIPDIKKDRSDVLEKIKRRYYNFVVYGSIRRCQDYIEDVLFNYKKTEIFFVDGEDDTEINFKIVNSGFIYLKRELIYSKKNLLPINFAIPTRKINFVKNKEREIALIDPRDIQTYIYDKEIDYYKGYQQSCLAFTMKKAGWDCLRHYEIIANGCLPIFIDINECPDNTLTNFNKIDLLNINTDYYKNISPKIIYEKYSELFENYCKKYLTTIKLAENLVNLYTKLNK